MPSNIHPSSINTNIPVANSDNNSQTLRDNFSQISAQFATAASEISALQSTTVKLGGPIESNVVVLTSNPNGTLVLTRLKPTDLAYSFDVPGTGAMKVPVGNTAQRPQSAPLAPSKGMIRYNTDSDTLEFYKGNNWIGISGIGATPVTKTADFVLGTSENLVICNGTGNITVTLPAASSWSGRQVSIKTIAAHAVNSASANVVPRNSATPGTPLLSASAGAWATLISDGVNWIVMAGS